MSFIAAIFLWALAIVVAAPAIIMIVEIAASFAPSRRPTNGEAEGAVAAVIPAHNEGRHIIDTLQDLRAQLGENDRLIVVADNCTDDTAAIAEAHGAEVFVRNDSDRRGKGYALQFAIDRLGDAPPDYVMFFDADCRIGERALRHLAGAAAETKRPVQALYLMEAPEASSSKTRVAAFAWLMINRVRMAGLAALFNVTRFTGSGLAASWKVMSQFDFASGDITEDLAMTLKMARAGAAPVFASNVLVTSQFPQSDDGDVTQRARWEHGSLDILTKRAFPALLSGLGAGNIKYAALALDAMVPPLMLLVACLVAAFMTVFAAFIFGVAGAGPFLMLGVVASLFALSVIAAWLRYGRAVLPPSEVWALTPFVLQKLKIYGGRGRESSKTWTRTERDGEGGDAS